MKSFTTTTISVFLVLFSLLPATAQTEEAENDKTVDIVIKTSLGDMQFELYPGKAPDTVANFLHYADSGYYGETIFHRVIENFMIQGGGFDRQMHKKNTRSPVTNEADNGLKNTEGSIAMARTGDPHSATSQFFINTQDNPGLDHSGKNPRGWGYAVFGQLISGRDTLEAIASQATTQRGPHRNVPVTPVIIQAIERLPGEEK